MIKEKLVQARESNAGKNCIGTALFLCGVVDKDEAIGPLLATRTVSQMRKLPKPEIGCLMAFMGEFAGMASVIHLGVVTNVSPLKLTYRDGGSGNLIEEDPATNVYNQYGDNCIYFKPEASK